MQILNLSAVLSVALAGIFAPPILAQASGSAKLQSDIRFIRGLVSDLRFFELAEHETENLKKTYKDADDFKQVTQLAIEVSLEGAKRHPEREKQRALYKDAIDKTNAFLERYSGDPIAADARATLVQAIAEYGQFLNDELELARAEAPDQVGALEEEASKIFRQGTDAANSVMTDYKNRGRQTEIPYFLAWMRKGILDREHARAVAKERVPLCEKAKLTLEELILELGEDTALGQRALFEMAQVEQVLGNQKAAIGAYKDTAVQIMDALGDETLNLPKPVQVLMFDMMQEVYDHLAITYVESGQGSEVPELVAKYRKELKTFQAEPHARFGDSLFLTEARVMADSGDKDAVSKALGIAKEINKRHPYDFVGLRAKKLIESILDRSADLVTGEALLEVARGFYQEKKYDAAILRFKSALRQMTEDERNKLGLETWDLIGRAHGQLGRNLEAALCHKAGLIGYGDKTDDKDLTRSIARRMRSAMQRAFRDAKEDGNLVALKTEIEGLEGRYNESVAAAREFVAAQKLYDKRSYAEAAQVFDSVKPDYDRYEMAIAYRIDALIRTGKFDDARKAVADYREWLTKPQAELPKDSVKNGYRVQAIQNIDLAEARIHYTLATGSGKADKADLSQVPEATKALLAWEQKHKTETATTHDMIGELALLAGQPATAMDRYKKLKDVGQEQHNRLGHLIFNYQREQVTAAETQFNAVTEKSGPEFNAARTKLASARKDLLTFAQDYDLSIGKPAYSLLFTAMQVAEDAKDSQLTARFAERTLKLYDSDPRWSAHKTFINVKPALGQALLRQNKVQRAHDMLVAARKELVDAKKDQTESFYELTRMIALARGGWCDLDEVGNYQAYPGLSQSVEAYEEYGRERRIVQYFSSDRRVGRYSLMWYRYHLECLFMARQAERKDTKYKTNADAHYNIAKSVDDFNALRQLGQRGRDMELMFRRLAK